MKCILHVGTEKTATTTLQRFFDRNRDTLGTQGIAYTRSAGVGNNWRLAVAAYDDGRRDDRSADAGIGDANSRGSFRSGLLNELGAELEDSGDKYDIERVLFSSEHFHSRLTTASEIERLADLLAKLGVTTANVVIYLRDPVSLAASLHSTVVKHGSARRAPPEPELGTYYRHLCDHRSSIQSWEAVFDKVTPRLFEPEALVGGSVVSDFFDLLGVTSPSPGSSNEEPYLNRSLTTAEIEVLSRINGNMPSTIDGQPNPRQTRLVAALERHSTGPGYRLPPGLAQRYRAEFTHSNEWIRQRFFPEREHLFAAEAPDHDPGPRPPGYDGLAALLVELIDQAG